MFIDEVIIDISAGKGGDGCTSFRHEKYIEKGGPDGGDGGKGADVVFIADAGLKTLIDLRYKKVIKADSGEAGSGNDKYGKSAADLIIKVPTGTVVIDTETGSIIADLIHDKETKVICKGGKGGRGNAKFMTNKNKAPLTSERGELGERKKVKCELKLLADIGLVGFPSVGKSSIISVISASKPKIADYPFTTLSPNLGVVKVDNYSFTVADLPGLIENASNGAGLGIKFLKHLSRTKVIYHILDMSEADGRNVIDDYKIIRKELKNYSEDLFNKTEVVVANKMDTYNALDNLAKFKKEFPNLKVIKVSAITKEGINNLIYDMKETLKITENKEEEHEVKEPTHVIYEYKKEIPFIITKENNTWVITGERVEKILQKTKFNSDEAEMRFAKKLERLGLDEKLKEMGAKEGDTCKILDYEFTYEERYY